MVKYPKFKEGDKVMFARTHLRNIGVYTGEMCFLIGTVVAVSPAPLVTADTHPDLVTVCWTGHSPSWPKFEISTYGGTIQRVLACNLEHSPFDI